MKAKIQSLAKSKASEFPTKTEEYEPGNPDSDSQRDRYQNYRGMGPGSD